jgi:hypothetical protein
MLGEIAANDRNMLMPSPESIVSQLKRSVEKKRMRTLSLLKNQRRFPNDAYSPDNIEDATPRLYCFARSVYLVPNLLYKEALSNEPIIEDDDDL